MLFTAPWCAYGLHLERNEGEYIMGIYNLWSDSALLDGQTQKGLWRCKSSTEKMVSFFHSLQAWSLNCSVYLFGSKPECQHACGGREVVEYTGSGGCLCLCKGTVGFTANQCPVLSTTTLISSLPQPFSQHEADLMLGVSATLKANFM